MGLFEDRGLLPKGYRWGRSERGLRWLVPRVTRGRAADDSETRITHATSANQRLGFSLDCTKSEGQAVGPHAVQTTSVRARVPPPPRAADATTAFRGCQAHPRR